jgi:hypothetical protein
MHYLRSRVDVMWLYTDPPGQSSRASSVEGMQKLVVVAVPSA